MAKKILKTQLIFPKDRKNFIGIHRTTNGKAKYIKY